METVAQGLVKALSLLYSFDPELYSIIALSLKVSGTAVLAASAIGIPVGALTALKSFPGKRALTVVMNTFMGLPPVVAGLAVYLFLSRSGPLGFLGLLYSPAAMVVAQTAIALPIVAALVRTAVAEVDPAVRETALTLGASEAAARWRVVAEARAGVMAAVIAGFGRTMAEVGAVLIVGGNIAGYTRVMTTAIAMETSKGEFTLAIALGVVLLAVSFCVNVLLGAAQGGGRREWA